jgi:hypothetical protein
MWGELSEVLTRGYRNPNNLAKIGCGEANIRGMWRPGT